jgi:LmbE family N-acetylglucosaminyl deacetylase
MQCCSIWVAFGTACAFDSVHNVSRHTAKTLSRQFRLGAKDSIWDRHIDRKFMRDAVFPLAGQLAGTSGRVLEVVYMPFNADSSKIAGMDADHWHFVDPEPRNFDTASSGTLLGSGITALVEQSRLHHTFRVIIDCGVLGWKLSELLANDASSLNAHVRAYRKLLTAGGGLLIEIDTKNNANEPNIWAWPKLHDLLTQEHGMELERVNVLHTEACSAELMRALCNVTSRTGGNDVNVRVSAYPPTKAGQCESYIFSQWWVCNPELAGGGMAGGMWRTYGASSLARYSLPSDVVSQPPSKLMIVAHPDDDMIFGGAELLQAPPGTWMVVAVTTGTARSAGKCTPPRSKNMPKPWGRRREFFDMLKLVQAHGEIWDFRVTWPYAEGFSYSDQVQLSSDLAALMRQRSWEVVVTHGRNGEYNNIQHKQLHNLSILAARDAGLAKGQLRFFATQTASLPPELKQRKLRSALQVYPSQAFVIRGKRGAPSLDKWLNFEGPPVAQENEP